MTSPLSKLRIAVLLFGALIFSLPVHATGFKNPQIILTPKDAAGIVAGDLNGDGKADIAYIDSSNPSILRVLLGTGGGHFHQQYVNSLPAGTCGRCGLTLADVNGDGRLDVIVAGYLVTNNFTANAFVAVLLGNGDGTFQEPISTPLSGGGNFPSLGGIAVGDLNHDGFADIVICDAQNNQTHVLLGDGAGHFTEKSVFFSQGSSSYLYDLNGDGKLDLVQVCILCNGVDVFMGNGDGTFQNGHFYTFARSVQLVDLDGDGHPDLVGIEDSGQVAMMKGNSDGTFGNPIQLAVGQQGFQLLRVADFTGDGILDIGLATPNGPMVLVGQGNLNYIPSPITLGAPMSRNLTAVADTNGDSKLDIVAGFSGGIAIFYGNGDGTFASADDVDLGRIVVDSTVADFNHDGRLDIAVLETTGVPRVLLNQGNGIFQPAALSAGTGNGTNNGGYITAGDFDGDGKPDVVVTSGTPQVWYGNGDGTFANPISVPKGSYIVADVNGDGRSDIITLDTINGVLNIAVLFGQSNRTFTEVTTPLRNPTFAVVLAVGDVNRDGKLDLLISNSNTNVDVWLGNGDGTFTYSNTIDISTFQAGSLTFEAVAIGDLDGDGKADVVLGSSSQSTFAVLYGNGDGTFQAPKTYPLSRSYTGVRISDVDKDGKPDLIFFQAGGLSVVPNLGGRQFDQEQPYLAGSELFKINVVDINGDDFPDVIASTGGVINSVPSVVAILYGGAPNNSLLSAFLNLSIAPEPSEYGQTYSATFTASPTVQGNPIPSGSASMSLNGSLVATQTLNQGSTAFTVSGNRFPGAQNVTIAYNGDDAYRASSIIAQHYVNPPVFATQTQLSATPTTLETSQTVRLIATVTTAGTHLQGSVTFMDGITVLRTKNLDSNNRAVLDTATLNEGTHVLSATYHGVAIFNDYVRETYASSSTRSTVTVNAVPTTTTLTTSATAVLLGTVSTFTATVSAAPPPFGSVVFDDGLSLLGIATLKADGTAVLSTIWRSGRGRHDITAHYIANSVFASSDSSPVTVSIQRAPASTTPTVTTLTEMRSEGQTALVGHVIPVNSGGSGDGPIGGQITFLNNGEVLGAAYVDANGFVRMQSSNLNSELVLSASFSGDRTHAPSASPELHVVLPTADSFSIAAMQASSSWIYDDYLPIEVTVVTSNSFHDMVALGCGDGLPQGYSCTFTPSSLNGGGASQLFIVKDGALAKRSRNLGSGALVLACFMLSLAGVRRRRTFGAALSCLVLMCMTSCGTPLPNPQDQTVALTITAKSMSVGSAVLRSTQIAVRLR